MYAISLFFLGFLLKSFIGADAMDLVKMPFGLDLPVGAQCMAQVLWYCRTVLKCFRYPYGEVILPDVFF